MALLGLVGLKIGIQNVEVSSPTTGKILTVKSIAIASTIHPSVLNQIHYIKTEEDQERSRSRWLNAEIVVIAVQCLIAISIGMIISYKSN